MSEPAIDVEAEASPEISSRASETIASWRRVLVQTAGDKQPNFERACVELFRLAAIEGGAGKQAIVDELADMAVLAGIDPDHAQQTFARAGNAPPDGRPTIKRPSRPNGNEFERPLPQEPPPASSEADYLDDDTSFGPPLDDPRQRQMKASMD